MPSLRDCVFLPTLLLPPPLMLMMCGHVGGDGVPGIPIAHFEATEDVWCVILRVQVGEVGMVSMSEQRGDYGVCRAEDG